MKTTIYILVLDLVRVLSKYSSSVKKIFSHFASTSKDTITTSPNKSHNRHNKHSGLYIVYFIYGWYAILVLAHSRSFILLFQHCKYFNNACISSSIMSPKKPVVAHCKPIGMSGVPFFNVFFSFFFVGLSSFQIKELECCSYFVFHSWLVSYCANLNFVHLNENTWPNFIDVPEYIDAISHRE